jgi:succinate-acetate transporter protein
VAVGLHPHSFGGTTVLLSLYNLEARGVKIPNVITGVALMYGGICQIICEYPLLCLAWHRLVNLLWHAREMGPER